MHMHVDDNVQVPVIKCLWSRTHLRSLLHDVATRHVVAFLSWDWKYIARLLNTFIKVSSWFNVNLDRTWLNMHAYMQIPLSIITNIVSNSHISGACFLGIIYLHKGGSYHNSFYHQWVYIMIDKHVDTMRGEEGVSSGKLWHLLPCSCHL